MRRICVIAAVLGWLTFQVSPVRAQGSGSYRYLPGSGGESRLPGVWQPAHVLIPEVAQEVIVVEATVERRVKPDTVRLVLAFLSEAVTADQCQQQMSQQIQAVRTAWAELKVPAEHVVEDFINVLPRYEWRVVDRDGEKVRRQQRSGYRLQTNLHLAVPTEEVAGNATERPTS